MSKLISHARELLSSHRTFFLATGGIVVLLLLTILTLPKDTLESLHSPVTPTSSPSSQGTNDPARHALPQGEAGRQSPTPIPPPSVSFESYENRSTLPSVPQSVSTYVFKTNYTVEEARSFGTKFGMTEVKSDNPKYVVMSNLTDMNNRGMLIFDRETGGFQFQSWGNHIVNIKDQNAKSKNEMVKDYLTELDIIDPTVSCPTTYQKQGLMGVTYVECHRDWSKVGGTILNFIGLLNVPEDTSLASLSLGKPSTYTPDDPTIINTSDNSNGKARLTDFNTLTVGVADDGRILTIDSNLRTIVQASTVVNAQLLTPEEALNQLTLRQVQSSGQATNNSQQITNNSKLSLTIPAGSGSVDWNKVYPNNQAKGKKAIITDYLLTYLEKPGQVPQDNLVPMYVIRGTAELSSGYTVRFTETVPATKSHLSFLSPLEGSVAGVSTSLVAQDDSGLKLGTFQPTIITPPTDSSSNPLPSVTGGGNSGGAPSPTPGGPSSSFAGCQDIAQLGNGVGKNEFVVDVPGLGPLTLVNPALAPNSIIFPSGFPSGYKPFYSHTFFFKSATFPVKDIEEVKKIFFQLVEDQYVIGLSIWTRVLPLDSYISNVASADRSTKKQTMMFELTKKIRLSEPGGGCQSNNAPPDPECSKIDLGAGAYYNKAKLQANYDNVSEKFYSAYEQSKINEWAAKPDIFPKETLVNFAWVFIDVFNGGLFFNPACYISGASPSLYLYPQSETKVSVHLPSSLSFSYPSALENNWTVTAHPDGTLSSTHYSQLITNNTFFRLYYEYDKSKVMFTEPSNGFVVKKDEWEGFIRNTLAPKLELTEREREDLVTDVENSLVDIKDTNYSYLKISLADPKEIDEKLPMTISPKPDSFSRIHLILTPLDSIITLPQPTIASIQRNGFTAVELGAKTQ